MTATAPANAPEALPPPPKVSVAMVTYNHEPFLAQAVQSVLTQETSFPYELVLSEDCSTDKTREIALDLQRRHPARIRLLLSDRNVGAVRNFMRTLRECRGEYVALLDGDDYWTSPRKLQRQAELLDRRPDLAMCYHDVVTFSEEGSEPPRTVSVRRRNISTLDDLLRVTPPSCSVMFRRGLFGEFPAWFETIPMFDFPLHVLNAQHGDVGYLDERMAAHRTHGGGVYSSLGKVDRLRSRLEVYEVLDRHLGSGHRALIRQMRSRSYYALAQQYEAAGDLRRARAAARRCVAVSPWNRYLSAPGVAALLFRVHAPRLNQRLRRLVRRFRSAPPEAAA